MQWTQRFSDIEDIARHARGPLAQSVVEITDASETRLSAYIFNGTLILVLASGCPLMFLSVLIIVGKYVVLHLELFCAYVNIYMNVRTALACRIMHAALLTAL